jgi:hypothetical protein
MNKVHGKTIFTQNGRSIQKLWQETCFFAENGQLLPLPGTRKKTYLSQSVWSTFAKLFAHIFLVVPGKILQLKLQKNNSFFVWASWAGNGSFEVFLKKKNFVL